jgi:hypothetical protein
MVRRVTLTVDELPGSSESRSTTCSGTSSEHSLSKPNMEESIQIANSGEPGFRPVWSKCHKSRMPEWPRNSCEWSVTCFARSPDALACASGERRGRAVSQAGSTGKLSGFQVEVRVPGCAASPYRIDSSGPSIGSVAIRNATLILYPHRVVKQNVTIYARKIRPRYTN